MIAYLCTQSDAIIKRSAMSSLIIDVDGHQDRSLNKLWEIIASKLIQLPGDGLPDDLRRLIIGINDSPGSSITALERLETASRTVRISGGVYSYVTNSALNFLYYPQIDSTT